jgi:hypothetical protein
MITLITGRGGRPGVPGSCLDASGFGQDGVSTVGDFAQFGDGVVNVVAARRRTASRFVQAL